MPPPLLILPPSTYYIAGIPDLLREVAPHIEETLIFFSRRPEVHKMEGAFTHLGNHLISDSAAAINAGADDLSTLDPDESLLYGQYGGRGGLGPSRRRNDDDDNATEVFDDDDDESLISAPTAGMETLGLRGPEEEKELPAHACA